MIPPATPSAPGNDAGGGTPRFFNELPDDPGTVRWLLALVLSLLACLATIVKPIELVWLLVPVVFLFVTWMPVPNEAAGWIVRRLANPTSRESWLMTGLVMGAAALHLALRMWRGERFLFPIWHDEFSYRLQSVMIAHGRLWATPPADLPAFDRFFDSFHLLVEPVYASIYWPGTALLNAPGVLLGLPIWLTPALLMVVTVGLVYRLAARLVDGLSALAAAVVAMLVLDYDAFGTRLLSQVPMAFVFSLILLIWLNWRETVLRGRSGWAWAIAAGMMLGLGAVTRPADALALSAPVGIAALLDLVRMHRLTPAAGWRRIAALLACVVIGAAPFLCVQLVLNHGTTGSFFEPPYVRYLTVNQPGTTYAAGDGTNAGVDPFRGVPEKRELHETWLAPIAERYKESNPFHLLITERIPPFLEVAMANPVGTVLFFMGLWVALGGLGRPTSPLWVPAVAVVGFLLIYVPNPVFLSTYSIPATVPGAIVIAAGFRATCSYGSARLRRAVTGALALTFLVMLLVSIVRTVPYGGPKGGVEKRLDATRQLARDGRAIVFVPYVPGNPHTQLVYNENAVLPAKADVIWARHLGRENRALLDYYRRVQPDRRAYLLLRPKFDLLPLDALNAWAAADRAP